jgi:RNA polymerase sigma factor (sigma-70 family)
MGQEAFAALALLRTVGQPGRLAQIVPFSPDDVIGKEFHNLGKAMGLARKGRAFYRLKRNCETIGGESRAQVAVNATRISCIKPLFTGSTNKEDDCRSYKGTAMATSPMSGFIQHLRSALFIGDRAGLTDGRLLTDYLSGREAASLAALVHRHGPMVWGVCRRMLRNYHDAEDAFQATFLVLVRKAATLQSRELLANWLYGVAHQTALKARATAAKRNQRERGLMEMPEPTVADEGIWRNLQPLLDEELSRLPGIYRIVFVLCDLEGKARKEVARQLNCPEGTVAGRLARARAMLAKRLSRRGVVASGVGLGALVSAQAASAYLPPAVACSTIKAATLVALGQDVSAAVSPRVAGLIAGVTKAMFRSKIKSLLATALAVGLALGMASVGAGLFNGPSPVALQSDRGGQRDSPVLTSTQEDNKRAPDKQGEKPNPPAADAKRDMANFQGTWRVVDTEEQGYNIYDKELKETFVVKGRTMTYCRDGKVQVTMTITLDPTKTPSAIILEFTDGDEKSHKNYAIYKLDGDTLKLRMNDKFEGNSEDERPTDFSTENGKGGVLFILKQGDPPVPTSTQEETRQAPEKQGEKPKTPAADGKREMANLQGAWRVVGVEEQGNNVYDKDLKETFVVKGRTLTYCQDGKVQVTMKIGLNPTKDPPAILLEFTDGIDKGNYNHAIYNLEGDTLKLRMNDKFGGNKENERPTDFSTDKGKEAVLFTLKRETK